MPVFPENITKVIELLEQRGINKDDKIISINLGATKHSKLWVWEKFVDLIDILITNHNAKVILTGAETELNFDKKILESSKTKPISMVNTLRPQGTCCPLFYLKALYWL